VDVISNLIEATAHPGCIEELARRGGRFGHGLEMNPE
jgi:hypothetical protein